MNLSRLAGLSLLAWILALPTLASAPNDSSELPIAVAGTEFTLTADLSTATREPFEPTVDALHGRTLWWQWTAPSDGVMGWSTTPSPNAVHVSILQRDALRVWDVIASTYLRPLPPEGSFAWGPRLVPDGQGWFQAHAGTTYWIRLDGVQRTDGIAIYPSPNEREPYPVTVQFVRRTDPPPAMDDFDQALELSLEKGEFGALLASATLEANEPRAHPEAVGATAWWRWTAPGPGTVRIAVAWPEPAPLLGVFERSTWNRLELVTSSATEYGNACSRFWRARPRLEWDTRKGATYFIQADAFPDFDRSKAFLARIQFVPAPENDRLQSPTLLSGTDWSRELSNNGATRTPEEPSSWGWDGTSTVWVRWTLPGPGLVQVTTNEPARFAEPGVEILPPGPGPIGSIFTHTSGPCAGPFEDLRPLPTFAPILALFRRDGTSGDLPLLSYRNHGTNEVWAEVDGTELWIGLDGPGGTTGTSRLNARLTPPPPNDRRADRIVLPSAPVRVTGRTAGATREPDDVFGMDVGWTPGANIGLQRSVWWEWQAPSDGTWLFEVATGSHENSFAVHRGQPSVDRPAAVGLFAGSQHFTAAAGESFQIGVFSLTGWGSNVEFRIAPASVPRLVPPSLVFDDLGRPGWVFTGLAGWRQPFVVETSTDLRHWTVADTEWFLGTDTLRLRHDPAQPAGFVRFRSGP
jgi:hypothetical protein